MARLNRKVRVSRKLHSLLNAPIKTTGPSRKSEKELEDSGRINTCFPPSESTLVIRAMVTVSSNGTEPGSEAGLGDGGVSAPSFGDMVGGPWARRQLQSAPASRRAGLDSKTASEAIRNERPSHPASWLPLAGRRRRRKRASWNFPKPMHLPQKRSSTLPNSPKSPATEAKAGEPVLLLQAFRPPRVATQSAAHRSLATG